MNLVMYRHSSWEKDSGFTPNLNFNPVFTKFNFTEFLHTSVHQRVYPYFKFTVHGRKQASKQASLHTHVRNAVMLVWGSLRLAPMMLCTVYKWGYGSLEMRLWQSGTRLWQSRNEAMAVWNEAMAVWNEARAVLKWGQGSLCSQCSQGPWSCTYLSSNLNTLSLSSDG